jgi:cellobiose phosphorylase
MGEQMKNAINESCWDGEWYKRAFDDESNPLGSKENTFGKIFINSQSWAVLGGVSDEKRSQQCLESVNKYLNTKYGIVTMYPSYVQHDPTKGGITTYPPGAKENGGIFCHTNPWVMIAEVMMGNGNRAFEYYKQLIPAVHNDEADRFEVEPYVYPQNILGKEHPQFGIGRNSWLSGTAAWNMVASCQYILGIRPGYDCLIIDPCIPSEWDGFRATRIFRGAEYRIEVKNDTHVCRGVKKITLNGKEVDRIPVQPAGSKSEILVEMG